MGVMGGMEAPFIFYCSPPLPTPSLHECGQERHFVEVLGEIPADLLNDVLASGQHCPEVVEWRAGCNKMIWTTVGVASRALGSEGQGMCQFTGVQGKARELLPSAVWGWG